MRRARTQQIRPFRQGCLATASPWTNLSSVELLVWSFLRGAAFLLFVSRPKLQRRDGGSTKPLPPARGKGVTPLVSAQNDLHSAA